jgi:hypothetical protein
MTVGKSTMPLFVANIPHIVLASYGDTILLIEHEGGMDS